MNTQQKPLAWLPFSIAEASLTGATDCDDRDLAHAWSYLLDRLRAAAHIVETDPATRNRVDLASGLEHQPGSRGAHEYDLADYGLTPAGVRERFADYLTTYDASA